MTALAVVEAALLVVGVASMLVCCLGVATMPGAFARIHYQSAASTVPVAAIVLAVVLHAGLSATSLKAVLILAISWTSGPILTHALARAARRASGEPEGSR